MPLVPPTLAIIALDLTSVTPPGLRLVISGHIPISGIALSLGSLATGANALPVSSQTLMAPLLWVFSGVLWVPFNSWHQLLLNFDHGF